MFNCCYIDTNNSKKIIFFNGGHYFCGCTIGIWLYVASGFLLFKISNQYDITDNLSVNNIDASSQIIMRAY